MAAYTYFVKLIRDEHRKKHPDEHFDFAEFSAKCAEKWKSMKPEERKRFEELASEEGDKKPRKKRTRKRQKKAPGQPKRAWSAFFYFCDERRPKVRKDHPEWRVAEVARELGHLWEACSDRDKYEKMAVLDKERYEKEMEQFRAGNFVAGETKRPKLSDNQEDEEDHDDEEEEEDDAEGSSANNRQDGVMSGTMITGTSDNNNMDMGQSNQDLDHHGQSSSLLLEQPSHQPQTSNGLECSSLAPGMMVGVASTSSLAPPQHHQMMSEQVCTDTPAQDEVDELMQSSNNITKSALPVSNNSTTNQLDSSCHLSAEGDSKDCLVEQLHQNQANNICADNVTSSEALSAELINTPDHAN